MGEDVSFASKWETRNRKGIVWVYNTHSKINEIFEKVCNIVKKRYFSASKIKYFESQEGYSWGIGYFFCFRIKKYVSSVSEWKRKCLSFQPERKQKGRENLDSDCDFRIGRKLNEEKWIFGSRTTIVHSQLSLLKERV